MKQNQTKGQALGRSYSSYLYLEHIPSPIDKCLIQVPAASLLTWFPMQQVMEELEPLSPTPLGDLNGVPDSWPLGRVPSFCHSPFQRDEESKAARSQRLVRSWPQRCGQPC